MLLVAYLSFHYGRRSRRVNESQSSMEDLIAGGTQHHQFASPANELSALPQQPESLPWKQQGNFQSNNVVPVELEGDVGRSQ
jgi:hypothetical protein